MSQDNPELLSTLRERSRSLFEELRGQEDAPAARHELIELHLPLVEHCARRFMHRGEPLEDLVQVGTIGLIKAVDRFDTITLALVGIGTAALRDPRVPERVARDLDSWCERRGVRSVAEVVGSLDWPA